MRAIVIENFGATPLLADVPEPICPPDGVVVEVVASGLCRSDWHAWQGHEDSVRVPYVPGHEFAGRICAVGDRVSRFHTGQRVCAPFVMACGHCAQCRVGEHQVCVNQLQPGFTQPGSFAERVVVQHADTNVVELPNALDFDTATSLGCRFATAYRAVTVHGQPGAGDWVCVYGCGGVGLSVIMIAISRGAQIIAVDTSHGARERAIKLGAAYALDARRPDVVSTVRKLSGGGAHVSFDAIGSAEAARGSVGCLRPRGRHIQIGLLLGGEQQVPVPMDQVISNELEIYGSHGMPAHGYREMLDEISHGHLNPSALANKRITLEELPEEITAMSNHSPDGVTLIYPNP